MVRGKKKKHDSRALLNLNPDVKKKAKKGNKVAAG